jgi:hypothetical protein
VPAAALQQQCIISTGCQHTLEVQQQLQQHTGALLCLLHHPTPLLHLLLLLLLLL